VKRAPLVAASVVIVASIAAVAVRWGGGGTDERNAPAGHAGGESTAKPADAASAPRPPAPAAEVASESARVPESAGDGERALAFDLRGPDDLPLESGVVSFEGERERGKPTPRVVQRDWRRAAPRLVLPAWTAWIHAEADSIEDDLVNFDLASDREEFDRTAPIDRDAPPRTLRLQRRSGIFGRVRDVVEASWYSVACRTRPAGDRRSWDGDEVVWSGNSVPVMRRADGVASYSIVGLEPGRYLLAILSDSGAGPGPVVEVEVADRMARVDLVAKADERATLLVHVVGLPDDERASVEFGWIDSAVPGGGGSAMKRLPAGDDAFRVTPGHPAERSTMRRLLAGELAPDEHCTLLLLRKGETASAQPLENGQHEATFTLGADASLTVRIRVGDDREGWRFDALPAPVAAQLDRAPAASDDDAFDGTSMVRRFQRLAPGDFVLRIWRPLKSALHHGEVWWPVRQETVTLHAGDQELELDAPSLHPLTIRFDRARFGAGAKVQLVMRGHGKWPRYAAPDERGVARFDDVPAGDYTVAVIGDEAGQVDCTVPETSEITVEPTRRDK